jgi:hypothetical protein
MPFANSHRSFVSITALLDENQKPQFPSKTNTHAMGSTTPSEQSKRPRLAGHAGIIPLRISTILTISVLFSLFFITAMSFAFMGDEGDEPHFKKTLNDVAQNTPGVSDSIRLVDCQVTTLPPFYRLFY